MSRETPINKWPFWGFLFFMSLPAYLFQTQFFLESDVIYLIHAASSLLKGGNYTENFFETNPPLILYLYFPILFLMQQFKIKLVLATRIYLIGLSFISLYGSNYFLEKNRGPSKQHYLLVATLAFILLFLPFAQFAQREHLLLILTMPYWCLAALRAEKIDTPFLSALLAGLLGGAGFALKPFFLIPLALVELYLALRNRSFFSFFRVETITLALVFIAYGLSILFFQPDYLTLILPLVAKYYFIGSSQPWINLLKSPPAVFCFAVLLFCPFFYRFLHAKTLAAILSLALFGFSLSFLIPQVAWYYHIFPAFGMSYLLGALMLSELENIFMVLGFSLIFLMLPFFNAYGLLTSPFAIKNSSALNELIDFTNQHFPQKKIYCIPAHYACSTLNAYADSSYASRFPSFWVMNGILVKPASLQVTQDKLLFLALLAEDIETKKPDLFIFDRTESLGKMIKAKEYIAYFSQNLSFEKAWGAYHYLKTIGPYELYVR